MNKLFSATAILLFSMFQISAQQQSHRDICLEKLYRTIDAMPMRQEEMKQQKP